jgi:hypothetical protein
MQVVLAIAPVHMVSIIGLTAIVSFVRTMAERHA